LTKEAHLTDIVSGSVRIAHQSLKEVTIFGKKVTYKKAITVPVMYVDRQLVMSDAPQERLMMEQESKGARGRALVAGLGLGVILEIIRPHCDRIVVVEKNEDVIDAYRKFRNGKPDFDAVIVDTIEHYLEDGDGERFDYIHLDTWYSLDYEDLPHINWMVRRAAKLLNPMGRIEAWGLGHIVKGFRRECLEVMGKSKIYLRAKPKDVGTIKGIYPMIGEFIEWFRANPKASRKEAVTEIDRMTSREEKSGMPLEARSAMRWLEMANAAFEPTKRRIEEAARELSSRAEA
jgi:hypothetical protein